MALTRQPQQLLAVELVLPVLLLPLLLVLLAAVLLQQQRQLPVAVVQRLPPGGV